MLRMGVAITMIPPKKIPPPHHQLCIPIPNATAITNLKDDERGGLVIEFGLREPCSCVSNAHVFTLIDNSSLGMFTERRTKT